ncbi:MAG: ABC transporter permease subunit [Clostridia bacterium]
MLYFAGFQDINIIFVGTLAFGLNSAAYVAEIIRAGLGSIDLGQAEAGRSLGLSKIQTMRYIIMPQAIKNILPTLGNEFISLVKETAVAGYIGIMDLTKSSDIIASRTYDYFFPLIIVAIIYLIIVLGLTSIIKNFERSMLQDDKS